MDQLREPVTCCVAPFADVPIAAIDPGRHKRRGGRHTDRAPDTTGTAYRLSGPQALRAAEQVATLAEMLDQELRYEGQSDEEARAEMSGEMPEAYIDAFFRYYSDGT